MAKSSESLANKYPDVSGIFAAREKLRRQRADESPAEKLRVLVELRELDEILKSARVIKKGGVPRN
ncbi:MAG: hypothetical protein ABIO91_04495 [Pyrinomonadaceae bacterium]